MAWVVIPDSDLDPDSPITTSLMFALRDNVPAAFGKDAGAPVLSNNYIASAMLGSGIVTQSKMASNAIGSAEIKKTFTTGSQAVISGTPWIPAAGLYQMAMISSAYSIRIEILVDASWWPVTYITGSINAFGGLFLFDGTNMRVNNSRGVTQTVYYQKF